MSMFVDLLKKAKKDGKLVLIASLPKNDPELAKVVLDAGADVVKIHINVHHHASDTHFGTLSEERKALEKILNIWTGKPVGIMPFAQATDDAGTYEELAKMGFDFYSQYLGHAISGCLPAPDRVARMLALSVDDSVELATGLDAIPIQVCELSIMDGSTYGFPFTFHDLLRYSAVRTRTNLPLVVPSQHLIKPESVKELIGIGIEGLMIGAVVAGRTNDSWKQATDEFRKAIDQG